MDDSLRDDCLNGDLKRFLTFCRCGPHECHCEQECCQFECRW